MPSEAAMRTVEIQDRDLDILRELFVSRVMTAEHIAAIDFDGRYEAARKRIQKLKAAGYVGERPRRAYDPAVLFLTKRAFALLCEHGAIAEFPHMSWKSLEKRVQVSPLTLRHELDVQDVKAAFYNAVAKEPNLEIAEFITWPALIQFKAYTAEGRLVVNKPDGFLRLIETTSTGALEHTFFIEVDRSTETLETVAQKACCYRDFYRRGGLALRNGQPASDYGQFPFRVLLIVRNIERRNHVAETLLSCHPPILSQVWLTTFEEMTQRPLDVIWVKPCDFRNANAYPRSAPLLREPKA